MLRWRRIARASHHNVQLFRNGKKILSAWPTRPTTSCRAWSYGGKRHRLGKGTYRWLLWAGYGHRSEHRYGKLLGKRTFIVTLKPATIPACAACTSTSTGRCSAPAGR